MDDNGRDVMMQYVFSPSTKATAAISLASGGGGGGKKDNKPMGMRARKAAQIKTKATTALTGFNGIPAFEARGLKIRRRGEMIRPLFLSYDDLVDAWSDERECNPERGMPEYPQIDVVNVLDLCVVLDEDYSLDMQHELSDYGIVPNSANMGFVDRWRRKGSGKSRLHVRM